MPAWWRRKSKSSISSLRKDPVPAVSKARSFDFSLDCRRTGHPLPRPLASADSIRLELGAAWSFSSARSREESPEKGNLRVESSRRDRPATNPEKVGFRDVSPMRNVARAPERVGSSDVSRNVSPTRNFARSAANQERVGSRDVSPMRNVVFASQGARSPVPLHRVLCNLSHSPFGPLAAPDAAAARADALRIPPHPLPLPPSPSPSESKWKKGKLLGRGTFGCVYIGFNSENGQMCAIKEVESIADDPNSSESLKQLNQEIDVLGQLSHPNIVQYLGSELNNGMLDVYLEYVSGGSLHKLVQEYGPLKESVIRNYVRQILAGLAYLHGRNCVHRDIKGANVLVGPNGDIKLADFGMAKHINSCVSLRSFRGSPYWMAPEVVMNFNGYTLAVDIWSLGCTIIEMATAKPPWTQCTGVQAIFKIGNSKEIPEIPDYLSSDAREFLQLCLQRDPSARPTAKQLMKHPFVGTAGKIAVPRPNVARDSQGAADCANSPVPLDFPHSRNASPMRDREYAKRPAAGYFPLRRDTIMEARANMSVPVSPCSSPLRQSAQANRSCFLSPQRQVFPAEMLSNAKSISRFTDNSPETGAARCVFPWRSPQQPLPQIGRAWV